MEQPAEGSAGTWSSPMDEAMQMEGFSEGMKLVQEGVSEIQEGMEKVRRGLKEVQASHAEARKAFEEALNDLDGWWKYARQLEAVVKLRSGNS